MKNNSTVCLFSGQTLTPFLPTFLILETVVGVMGNGLALWIFCFCLKPWKTSTVFLFNLALADFLLLGALPFRISYYLRSKHWGFGDAFCRVNLFMLAMNRTGSIFFLTAVALDRYFKVVHPHSRVNAITVSSAAWAACALWVLAICLTAQLLRNSHLYFFNNIVHCDSFAIPVEPSMDNTSWHNAVFLLEFALPLGIVLYCSFCVVWQLRVRELDKQAKIKQAVRFIGVVVIMFIICFLPSNVTRVAIWIKRAVWNGCAGFQQLDNAFYVTVSFTYLNSVLDPVVYYFSSPTFRRIYKKVMGSVRRKEQENVEGDEMSPQGIRETTYSQSLDKL
ncbi:hydroxycarboxylic acid receptor 3-like [Polypterus senegalus]